MTPPIAPADKICLPGELPARLAALPKPWVFTNGVFDILHRGHVQYLHEASQLGASLIVALNTDRSTRLLGKGPERPLNAELDRALVIGGLASVALVTFFDESTPLALLERVRPECYVKGGDYDIERLPETALVRGWGGRAQALPFVDGYSTTRLVQRMAAAAPARTGGRP
ncbi:adenylyltransferase/cytidyltransferase family protein [Aquincola sp. MAHUQ-54]|uniref:Adenylyltransferase/cytidyltransferase family protein n=1 Tax=Aquincola agrisoli TaxID=3119538 RepID=A0AAW9QEX9_9BURK